MKGDSSRSPGGPGKPVRQKFENPGICAPAQTPRAPENILDIPVLPGL